jgi:hypothetical protein
MLWNFPHGTYLTYCPLPVPPQNGLSYKNKRQISNITSINTTTNHSGCAVYVSIFYHLNSGILGVIPPQMMGGLIFQCY